MIIPFQVICSHSEITFAAKKEEKKGALSKLGLDDWKFALPAGFILGIPAIANEVSSLFEFNYYSNNFGIDINTLCCFLFAIYCFPLL
jgi:hypothetical protein